MLSKAGKEVGVGGFGQLIIFRALYSTHFFFFASALTVNQCEHYTFETCSMCVAVHFDLNLFFFFYVFS